VPDEIGLLMCIAPLQRAYAVAQADQAAGVQAGLGTAASARRSALSNRTTSPSAGW